MLQSSIVEEILGHHYLFLSKVSEKLEKIENSHCYTHNFMYKIPSDSLKIAVFDHITNVF